MSLKNEFSDSEFCLSVTSDLRNFQLFQTARVETCLYPGNPCPIVPECYITKCVQKFIYHRSANFEENRSTAENVTLKVNRASVRSEDSLSMGKRKLFNVGPITLIWSAYFNYLYSFHHPIPICSPSVCRYST